MLSRSLESSDNTRVIHPRLRHEMHNEIPADRDMFLALLSDCVGKRS